MWSAPGQAGLVEGEAGPVEQHPAGQRVPVGPQAGRGQADDAVARLDLVAGDQAGPLDHAHAEADQVEGARLQHPRDLGHLAADQGAAGLAAPVDDAADERVDLVRVEPADGDAVEEEEGLGALGGDVVDHHGHQVDADGVEAARLAGDEGLGAHAVGGRHQHRVAVAARRRRRTVPRSRRCR